MKIKALRVEDFERVSLEEWLEIPKAQSHYVVDDGNIIYLKVKRITIIPISKLHLFFDDVGELLEKMKQGAKEEDEANREV